MATVKQVKRRQRIEMAEGYLDLAMALDDFCTLDSKLRGSLVEQSLSSLQAIENPLGHKPYILFLKGQAYRAIERYEDAINYLEQSSSLEPDNIHTDLALAWCYKRTDQLPRAIEVMQHAVEFNSESAIAHYNLACYCSLYCQVDLALMHLTFALDLDSSYRDHVASESDFDAIRDNPRFASLAGVGV
ncbi:MAG: tetratricopeptide repeat protein [Mariniblastus sp.]